MKDIKQQTLAKQDTQMLPHLDHNPDHSGGGIRAQATPAAQLEHPRAAPSQR